MKRALIVVAVLGLTASLGAQSLVELAKREKERRAQYRGRHAAVITSRELALVKKTGGVVVTRPETGPGDEGWADGSEPVFDGGLVAGPADPGAAGEPVPAAANVEEPLPDTAEALADQLQAVDQLVESLAAEMNALRQRFESQNGMVPGYVIQEQLDETNQRLARAQARQAAIQAKMAKMGVTIKKDPEPAGR